MKPQVLRKIVVSVGMIGTLAILAGVYIVNGAEIKDAWLYIASASTVIVVMLPELFKKDTDQ